MTLSTLFFQANGSQWFYLIIFLLMISGFYFFLVNKCDRRLLFYMLGFGIFYIVNVLVGGILVGLSGGDWLLQLQPQGGYRAVDFEQILWPLYWGLLFLPLFLFPMVLVACFFLWPIQAASIKKNVDEKYVWCFTGILVLVFLFTFRSYSPQTFLSWLQGGGDFDEMIQKRGQILNGMNYLSLNLFYVFAPAVVAALFLKFMESQKWKDLVVGAFLMCLIFCFTILTFQKLLFFMTIMVVMTLLLLRSKVPLSLFLFAGLVLPLSLFLLSILSNNPFHLFEVLSHFFLRTGSVVIYYVAYLSSSSYFPGYDLPLDGRSIQDNVEIFRFMFPSSGWKGGTSSAPFHLRAYFQGGMLFLIIEFIFLGFLFRGFETLRRLWPESTCFLQSLSLVMFFYLCQTSLKDVLVSSYGLIFPLVLFVFAFDFNRSWHEK